MSLTTLQTQVRDYFLTGPASTITATWGADTKTLTQWLTLGNAPLIVAQLNSIPLGKTLNLIVPQTGVVANGVVRSTVASAIGFNVIPNDVLIRLDFILNGLDVDFSNSVIITAIQQILQAYEPLLTAFNTLLIRDASINDAVFDGLVTNEDIDAIIPTL